MNSNKRAHRKRAAAKESERHTNRVMLSTLGEAREIAYKHADGRMMVHKFNRGVRLGVTPCGKALVLSPVQVKPYIEG